MNDLLKLMTGQQERRCRVEPYSTEIHYYFQFTVDISWIGIWKSHTKPGNSPHIFMTVMSRNESMMSPQTSCGDIIRAAVSESQRHIRLVRTRSVRVNTPG